MICIQKYQKKYIKNHRQDIKKTIENCIYNDINYYDMNLQELENLIYEWVPQLVSKYKCKNARPFNKKSSKNL